jgi:uncharacterized protein YqeY
MSLFDKINEDIKSAMKEKDPNKLLALRAVKSELLLAKTKETGSVINEADEIKIMQKLIKQRKDSAEIYKQQNRNDLAEKELNEVGYLEVYLPKQMSDDELETILKAIIAQLGVTSPTEMGKVMGIATKQLAGKADNKTVSAKIKELLSK